MMNPKASNSIFLGALIRHFRTERKWTQKSLAFYLGVSTQHVRMIERGEKWPATKLEQKILPWFKDEREQVNPVGGIP